MDIQTTITDDQGAALAQLCRVTSYTDGGDLVTQAASFALTSAKRRGLIGAVAVTTDDTVLDAAIDAFNTVASTPIKLPPIKTGGPVKLPPVSIKQ